VSKARQRARAERERAAAERAAAIRAEQARLAAARARRERRALAWRRVRLWQHGAGFRRNRERWGVLATVALLALLLVYLFTRSVGAVLGTALVLVIAAPVLVLLLIDRRRT
jgi:Flp pilus assembly protein TadB